jgi:hypothetical protein
MNSGTRARECGASPCLRVWHRDSRAQVVIGLAETDPARYDETRDSRQAVAGAAPSTAPHWAFHVFVVLALLLVRFKRASQRSPLQRAFL